MTLLERLDRCPPVFCRLVARKNRGRSAMTRREIAAKSGLSLRTVDYFSGRISWRGIGPESVDAFANACGVDPLHPKRHVDWFLRRKRQAWKGREKVVARLYKVLSQRQSPNPGVTSQRRSASLT